jgi:hypothetical protein
VASGAGAEGGCVVSANYPPPDASKNDVDRFMLQFTHRRDEDIPDQDMWFSGIYATEEKPWPKDWGIAVVDAKGRVCRCVAEIRRALTEAAFPFELWWPKTSPGEVDLLRGGELHQPVPWMGSGLRPLRLRQPKGLLGQQRRREAIRKGGLRRKHGYEGVYTRRACGAGPA